MVAGYIHQETVQPTYSKPTHCKDVASPQKALKKKPKVAKIIIAKVAKAAKAKGPKKDQKWPETARNGIMWVKKR